MMNLVEFVAAAEGVEDCAFDQPCKFGHRVEGHAVYCHNDEWADSPRKCRRTWYTGGKIKDEDCPGFQPNPEFKGQIAVAAIPAEPCSACKGMKVIKADRRGIETCDRCMGDGAEPHAMPLSQYEQDTLEMGCEHTDKHPSRGERYVRIAETEGQRVDVHRLDDLDLISIHSISWTRSATIYLVSLTPKGDAVMHANWAAAKS